MKLPSTLTICTWITKAGFVLKNFFRVELRIYINLGISHRFVRGWIFLYRNKRDQIFAGCCPNRDLVSANIGECFSLSELFFTATQTRI
jgi:hypothetical protein